MCYGLILSFSLNLEYSKQEARLYKDFFQADLQQYTASMVFCRL